MEYQVPQFIEIEDKIFGPLTLKQFIYLAGGAGVVVVALLTLPFIVAIFVAIPAGALSLALAFYTMNGKSFVDMLEAGFNYYTTRRLYLWRKEQKRQEVAPSVTQTPKPTPPLSRQLSARKLHELAWSLDVKDKELTL